VFLKPRRRASCIQAFLNQREPAMARVIPQGWGIFPALCGRPPAGRRRLGAILVSGVRWTAGATLAPLIDMAKELGFNVELPLSFGDAVTRVREALKQEGFGVLTEIDLRAAFQEKLGREFRPYVILGACNPPLAFSAISADPSVGLLLPCNVTVEWLADGRSGVRLTDPEALLSTMVLQGAAELTAVARDARERMVRVAASLAGH
jgi:uncharacterized protein (DUF302 family)